jgi:hypothetical protein
MEERPLDQCPLCRVPGSLPSPAPMHETYVFPFDCRRCGSFELPGQVEASLNHEELPLPALQAIRYFIARANAARRTPRLEWEYLKRQKESPEIPGVAEQADNLLLLVGDGQRNNIGDFYEFGEILPCAKVGAMHDNDFIYLLQGLERLTLIASAGVDPPMVKLTFEGWAKHAELKRGRALARNAFMAMPFSNEQVQRAFENCFTPAVKETGFDLKRLDQEQGAGLIDDQLRVRLNTARFVIADLTDSNVNVFWEAGFAEGQRKPVIYTCESSYWESTAKKHFDTNHLKTIPWEERNLDEAAKRLAATIRWTIPESRPLEDASL